MGRVRGRTASPRNPSSVGYADTFSRKGEKETYYFKRVHFCVLHSGATMQPFSFSSLSLSSSMVPE